MKSPHKEKKQYTYIKAQILIFFQVVVFIYYYERNK